MAFRDNTFEHDASPYRYGDRPRRTYGIAAKETFERYGKAALEVLQETLWPTRCALCDTPGVLLCERCRRSLPFIDHWRICPRCGAPYGSVQCSECNPIKLLKLGEKKLPFDGCVSTVLFDDRTARLVKAYKDRNEQRLDAVIADLMAHTLPPTWAGFDGNKALSFIPSTQSAFSRRGFDHAELLADKLAERTGLPLVPLFSRPHNKDQRALSQRDRIHNMQKRFTLQSETLPLSVLIIDDVYTTGSTLIAASKTLRRAGVEHIDCATFARVW